MRCNKNQEVDIFTSFPGQTGPVNSVGSWPFLLARASLPDDVAYRLAKALHKGHAALAAKLDQAQESTLENTLTGAPTRDLIHPGVLKYIRRSDWSERLIPLESVEPGGAAHLHLPALRFIRKTSSIYLFGCFLPKYTFTPEQGVACSLPWTQPLKRFATK